MAAPDGPYRVPVREGRGGHPPLVARSLFAHLARCADFEEGARTVLRQVARPVRVEVDDPGIHLNSNHPEDLAWGG
jgi:CTP:molybdopterin cytidylyltransferase MocA